MSAYFCPYSVLAHTVDFTRCSSKCADTQHTHPGWSLHTHFTTHPRCVSCIQTHSYAHSGHSATTYGRTTASRARSLQTCNIQLVTPCKPSPSYEGVFDFLRCKQAPPQLGGHKDTGMNSCGCRERPIENAFVQGPGFCVP